MGRQFSPQPPREGALSALDRAGGQSRDVVLDKERIDDRHGNRAEQRRCHQLTPVEHIAAHQLGEKVPPDTRPTSFDYLLTQAVSRLYLDNMPHIGSSWVTQGKKIGQVALQFGADDLGSVMIEENVVSAAGTTYRTSPEEFVHLIKSLGKIPVQRDTLYREVKVWN